MIKPDKDLFKSMAPKLIMHALRTFDKATIVVVLSCWAAAITIMLFALYSLIIVGNTKREVASVSALEPILPTITKSSLDKKELDTIVERLQKRFPDLALAIVPGQAVSISAIDGNKFRLWLTAISYSDTVFPQYRWSIKEFCVGLKCGSAPMKAILSVDKVSFSVKNK